MTTKWKLDGSYFEACNCEATCPCIFLSPPTEGECKALVSWHIDKGSYGDVNLDNLNVALFVHSPGNMVEGNWKVAMYLDDNANTAQQEGLAKIFSGQAGGHPSNLAPLIDEVLGVKTCQIEYSEEGKKRKISISDDANAEIEAQPGQGNADITVSNHPLAIAPGQSVVVARSNKANYKDHGIELEVSNKNGLYSPFSYENS